MTCPGELRHIPWVTDSDSSDETHHRTTFRQPGSGRPQAGRVAAGIEPVQDRRIHIEKINASFLYALKASGDEFGAEIKFAVERGWLDLYESGT
jgi:hypothetical protein